MHIDTRTRKFPRVTLLIPVFDSAAYVAEAVTAALAQTYGHIEIIIAPDDGDTYRHLRNTFTSPQLRILPPGAKIKTGAGPTRNRAIDASSGEYFAMLDADDLIPPNYVEDLMRVAMVDGAAIAPTRYTRWDPNDVVRLPPVHKNHLSLSGFAQLAASMHPLVHRSLEPGFCGEFAEDVVRDGMVIAKLGTIRVVDSVSYCARLRKGSACNSGKNAEQKIQSAYKFRIEQILTRPTELGMQVLPWEDRKDFVNLFRFRAFVSAAFAKSSGNCYNAWIAGREADLWDEFTATKSPIAFVD
jgi:glycosyltransferase involved in cell wall biosynthesis